MFLFDAVSDAGKHDKRAKADEKKEKQKSSPQVINYEGDVAAVWRLGICVRLNNGQFLLYPMQYIRPNNARVACSVGWLWDMIFPWSSGVALDVESAAIELLYQWRS